MPRPHTKFLIVPDFGVPAVEASEEEIGRAVRQPTGFDWIEIVDQEQEDVAVGRTQGRRVFRSSTRGL
jgi:hypothetical protein